LDDYNYDVSLNQLYRSFRHHLLHLAGLASGLAVVAGAASVLAGALLVSAFLSSFFLANFISVFGASALAGAVAAGAGVAGAFAGSAAIAVATDNVAIRAIANVFILSFLYVNEVVFIVYIYITR
jgi:hypothetical protein